MSLSQPKIASPCTRYINWNATESVFEYYDKDRGEKVPIEPPIRFIELDRLCTLRGWKNDEEKGFFSNEIRDIQSDLLILRTKNGKVMSGLYADIIKEHPNAKFTQSVYIALFDQEEMCIANIQLNGAGLAGWIRFCNKNKNYYGGILSMSSKEEKTGNVTYKIPVFEKFQVSEQISTKAFELDVELQNYLALYFVKDMKQSNKSIENTNAPGDDNGPQKW